MLKWYTSEKRARRKFLVFVTVLLSEYDLTWERGKHQVVDA